MGELKGSRRPTPCASEAQGGDRGERVSIARLFLHRKGSDRPTFFVSTEAGWYTEPALWVGAGPQGRHYAWQKPSVPIPEAGDARNRLEGLVHEHFV